MFAHNLDYDNYYVDMLHPKQSKCRYADWVQDAVLWDCQKLPGMPKNPPRASNGMGVVLVLHLTQSASNFAPYPMFVLS